MGGRSRRCGPSSSRLANFGSTPWMRSLQIAAARWRGDGAATRWLAMVLMVLLTVTVSLSSSWRASPLLLLSKRPAQQPLWPSGSGYTTTHGSGGYRCPHTASPITPVPPPPSIRLVVCAFLQLLPCTPDWDHEMESQNAAEVWLLLQLLVHPNRTHDWRKASVVVLPLLPKTSFRAGQCLGHTHTERLQLALKAMRNHPAYSRHWGHDHLLLFNYWDAWGVFGKRGTSTHAAMSNVSLGWHETQDVAWGMANHRHVGKCQACPALR